MSQRDYDAEHKDLPDARYRYDFDGVLRKYMMRTFDGFGPTGRALELGCYMGEFTELLAERFDDLTVVEASGELVGEARKRVPKARFVHSTFEEAELDGEFDAVFLIHTLEHLDDPVGLLRRVDRWLSPEGRLFVACPNANAPSRQIAVKMGLISHNAAVTEPERVHAHRITYSLDTLERDARAAGLHVAHRGGVFFKALANFQFDKLMGGDVIGDAYLEGCYELGQSHPDLCASVYLVCRKGASSA